MLIYISFITPYGEVLKLGIRGLIEPGKPFNNVYKIWKYFIIKDKQYPGHVAICWLSWRQKQIISVGE
jgi:hypothetical protein